MKKSVFATLIITMILLGFDAVIFAQEPGKTEMEQLFRRFKNYRFGSVALYQITNISEIRKAIEAKEQAASGTVKVDESAIAGIDEQLKQRVANEVRSGASESEIAQNLIAENIIFETDQLKALFNYYVAQGDVTLERIENIFVVTTKPKKGQKPETIIGMITSMEIGDKLESSLKTASPSNVYVYDELKQFTLDSSFSAANMYDLIDNAFIQYNVRNRTTEMQGIGKPGFWATQIFGKSKSLATNESNMSDYDIQKYLRISEKQPELMGINQNRVILSPDLISWKHYKLPTYWDGDVQVIDSMGSSNYDLPDLGIELKYGIDEANYFSFWSERLTAYALWKNVKLGLILPTNGWSNLADDMFGQERKLTHGGVGIAGEFDFPIKVIPKSGLFHLGFGYVFGDAAEAEYKDRDLDTNRYAYYTGDNDYLIRANFNFHYTFGMAIDQDYQLRFGVGFSGYNVEAWYYDDGRDTKPGEIKKIVYKQYDDPSSETIFGLSGKMDFMVTNVTTPFGASLQYFDEAVGVNIWLQIPLYKKAFALRLDAKGFAPISRDNHDWEIGGYFTPMARLILNF